MTRLIRWAVTAFAILASSLVLDLQPAQARWVRLGDLAYFLSIEQVCPDGIRVGVLYTVYDINGDPKAPDDLAPEVNIYHRDDFLADLRISLASGKVPLEYHDVPLQSGFDTSYPFHGGVDGLTAEGYGNYYGFLDISWITKPDFQNHDSLLATIGVDGRYDDGDKAFGDCLLFNAPNPTPIPNPTAEPGGGGSNTPSIGDERVNNYDASASAAVYCQNDGVTVYGIDAQGQGYFAFSVSNAQISLLGKPPQNTQLAFKPSVFGGSIVLSLLTSGQLQVTAPGLPPDTGKSYTYVWDGCGSSPSTGGIPVSNPNPVSPPTFTGGTTHTVQQGETLNVIARRYGVSISAIALANHLTNPNLIYAGQQLVIPTGTNTGSAPPPQNPLPNNPSTGSIHIVQSGENLFRIGLRYGVPFKAIASANGISNVRLIYVGQRLIIPR